MSHLLLVGGGHAHVEIVRRLAKRPVPGFGATIVSKDARPIYSGMVPGFVAGQYAADELEIDLPALATAAGVRFVHAGVDRIDPRGCFAVLDNGETIPWALASLDVGATVAGIELPGVAEHALTSRPIADLVHGIDARIEAIRRDARRPCRVVVVGAGAAGIELALCLRERLRRSGVDLAETTIVDGASRILPGASRSLSARVERALRQRSVVLRLGAEVVAVEPDGVRFDDEAFAPADLLLWVTGPAAHPLGRDSGLPIDARGFVRVGRTLMVEGHERIFAAGDCASLPGMRRAGVYAVRAAPALDHNLRAWMTGRPPRAHRPQRDFLSLLNLGDGSAIGSKWGVSFEGRWVMRSKDLIDRRFMEAYTSGRAERPSSPGLS